MRSGRPTIYVAVNVIVISKKKVLLGLRKGGWGAGQWATPGGHLEEGEAIEHCAARELKEETGMTARSFAFANVTNNPRGGTDHYVYVNLVALDADGEPFVAEPEHCAEWKWFPLNALPRDMVLAHATFLRAYIAKEHLAETPF